MTNQQMILALMTLLTIFAFLFYRRLDKVIETHIELLGVWYTTLMLIFFGIFLGIFTNSKLEASLSSLSDICTILGFYIALRAYLKWVKKDTISAQKTILREIIIEVSLLEEEVINSFSTSILEEMEKKTAIYPSSHNQSSFEIMSKSSQKIEQLMRNYYTLDVSPSESTSKRAISDIMSFSFDGDIFKDLRVVVFIVRRLERLFQTKSTMNYYKGAVYFDGPIKETNGQSAKGFISKNNSVLETVNELNDLFSTVLNRIRAEVS